MSGTYRKIEVSKATRDKLEAEAKRRGAAVYIATSGSEVGEWLREGRATAAVLRPDRTVMTAGTDASRLCSAVPAFG